jgi:hypothetical protein
MSTNEYLPRALSVVASSYQYSSIWETHEDRTSCLCVFPRWYVQNVAAIAIWLIIAKFVLFRMRIFNDIISYKRLRHVSRLIFIQILHGRFVFSYIVVVIVDALLRDFSSLDISLTYRCVIDHSCTDSFCLSVWMSVWMSLSLSLSFSCLRR